MSERGSEVTMPPTGADLKRDLRRRAVLALLEAEQGDIRQDLSQLRAEVLEQLVIDVHRDEVADLAVLRAVAAASDNDTFDGDVVAILRQTADRLHAFANHVEDAKEART